MSAKVILLTLVALISDAAGQLPFEASPPLEPIGQTQVTFLTASSAELAEFDGKTLILAEDLEPGRSYGVLLTVDIAIVWIEIHAADHPFPPKVQEQYKPGKFIVRGEPNQKFWVSLRGTGPPTFVEVVVAPDLEPGPVDPPVGDFAELTALSAAKASVLRDPVTSLALKTSIVSQCDRIDGLCGRGLCPSRDEAALTVVNAIQAVLLAREVSNVDWYAGWRRPVSDAVGALGVTDTATYVSIMRAVAKGL